MFLSVMGQGPRTAAVNENQNRKLIRSWIDGRLDIQQEAIFILAFGGSFCAPGRPALDARRTGRRGVDDHGAGRGWVLCLNGSFPSSIVHWSLCVRYAEESVYATE